MLQQQQQQQQQLLWHNWHIGNALEIGMPQIKYFQQIYDKGGWHHGHHKCQIKSKIGIPFKIVNVNHPWPSPLTNKIK